MLIERGSPALRLKFEEPEETTVVQLATLLYDLNLLNDCVVLTVVPEYRAFAFTNQFWYRNARPVKPEHRLYLRRISQSSPIELVTAFTLAATAVGIPWAMVQIVEKISNWRLNRQKLRLEVERLRLEVQKQRDESELRLVERRAAEIELENRLRERRAIDIFFRIIQNLEESKLRAFDADVFLIKREEDFQRRQ